MSGANNLMLLWLSTFEVWRYNRGMQLQRRVDSLDALARVIGFTATATLVHWCGGAYVHVPQQLSPDHRLAKLLGMRAATALVREYPGVAVWVPSNVLGQHQGADDRKREIARRLNGGHSKADIAKHLGLSQRQVQRIALALEDSGVLPVVMPG